MPEQVRQYVAIDAKSFYASVECVERQLNPLTTHLVVADESRTEKTICLAVSPALKAHGVPGRPASVRGHSARPCGQSGAAARGHSFRRDPARSCDP